MTDIFHYLKNYISIPGVSGQEAPVHSLIEKIQPSLDDEHQSSHLDSLHALNRSMTPKTRHSLVKVAHNTMIFRCLFLILLIAMFCVGCSGLPSPESTPTVAVPQTSTVTPLPTVAPSVTPPGPVTLRLWLPPQFDPDSGMPAGNILQARLDEFTSEHPDVRIEVRIKALDGPGGILDSLTSASAAAPLTLPDLVALPRPMMEAAALKGLLHPIDDMTESMTDSDWYEYAHQLARLQDSTFGLPFAGDAMIMVYHSTTDSEPPRDFATALETPGTLAFPAADPQALFTLTLYQATGGAIFDDQGRPFMDANNLEEVLTFYHNAAISELMPFWLTQYETDEQSWEAFLEDLADMVITWTTRYIDGAPSEDLVAHIPTPDGRRYTLATGWVWALVSPIPERQELSVQLAEFLTESDFLAEWTSVNGYLPPRPSALTNWKPIKLRTLISRVSSSAQLIPPADVLTSLGPPLEEATVQVLKLQSDPHTIAEDAAESLASP